jgi:hypothetical protein
MERDMELKMTNEERKRICEDLRNIEYDNFPEKMRRDIREAAAAEIERLAKDDEFLLNQLDGVIDILHARADGFAGLIEAAKRCTAEIVRDCIWPADSCTIEDNKIVAIIVDAMRAHAANRSGPADYIPLGGAGNGA